MKVVSFIAYEHTYGLTKEVFSSGYNLVWKRVGNLVHSRVKVQVIQSIREFLRTTLKGKKDEDS